MVTAVLMLKSVVEAAAEVVGRFTFASPVPCMLSPPLTAAGFEVMFCGGDFLPVLWRLPLPVSFPIHDFCVSSCSV